MISRFVPDEGFWVAVVVLDEVVDGGFEFLGGTVDAAPSYGEPRLSLSILERLLSL